MALFSILVDIAAKTASFEAGMKRVENQLAHFGEITKKTLEFAGVGIGLNELKNSIIEVVKRGAEFDSLAERMHTTTENLSQLEFIAKVSGVQFQSLAGSIDTMSKNIAMAAEHTGRARRAFQDLRIDAAALVQLPLDEQLDIVADKIAALGTATEQTALTMQIFGDLSALPALQKGSAGIRKLREESDELGNTLSSKVAKSLHETEDSVLKLSAAWGGLKTAIVGVSAPALTASFDFTRKLLGGETQLEKIAARIKEINYALYKAPSGSGIAKDATKNSAELNRELEKLYRSQYELTKHPLLAADSIMSPAAREAALENLKTVEAIQKARFGLNFDNVIRQVDQTTTAYANAQSQVKRLLDSGLIGEKDYYDAKRLLIEKDTDAQVEALNKESGLIRAQQALDKKRMDEKVGLTPDEHLTAERDFAVAQIENQNKIAENESKIQILRSKGRELVSAATAEQVSANRDIANSYVIARAAQQDFFDAQSNQQNLDLAGIGQSDLQRQFEQGRNSIQQKFARDRRDLELTKATNLRFTEAQYKEQLAIINQFEEKGLASYEKYYAQLNDKQSSFYLGAKSSIANYIDSATNIAQQANDLVDRLFSNMEDSLVAFVQTGKLNFSSFAQSVIADIARIQARQLIASVVSGLGGLFGGGGGGTVKGGNYDVPLPGRAIGGPVAAGMSYLIGERGPELFTPGASGSITPNNALGGNTVNVTTNIDARGATTDFAKQLPAILREHAAQLESTIVQKLNRRQYNLK